MNQDGSARTAAVPALLSLPAEVLSHICKYLVPSNQTFLLNARIRGQSDSKSQFGTRISPRIRGTPLLPEDDPTPQPPATIFQSCDVDIFILLLLHSKIYPRVVECLYSNNTFYPPDVATLLFLRYRLSPLAISSIRSIRVDACGGPTCFTRGYNYFYSWARLPDTDIVDIPDLFPGIRELRLGGVGPGVVHRRAFTYRGSNCVRETETNDVWTMDNILLISKIIGVSITDNSGVENDDSMVATHRALSNGRVFYMRLREPESSSPPRGSHRLHGTRIVRYGEIVRQGSMEEELFDVTVATDRARAAREECRALGVTEVSVHDISLE